MEWRYFLDNAISGLLEIEEPISFRDAEFSLNRDTDRHGVMKEYSVDFRTADSKAIEYVKNLYETQFVDVNIEIIIQELNQDDVWEEVFRGKLNIDHNSSERTGLGALILSATVSKTENDMRFFANRDQQVDLEENKDFEGNSLTAYGKLPFDLTLKPRTILKKLDLQNEYSPSTQVANTNGYGVSLFPTSCGGTTNDYTIEMLVDEWTIPIDNANYGHQFDAFIPIPFNKPVLDEMNIASDFDETIVYQTVAAMPSIITTDPYTVADLQLNIEGIAAACVLYCSEGNIPKVYAPGSFGSCIAGMDWVAISLNVDINGVNVYSNWLGGGTGLGKNGSTTNFLSNSGEYWMFDRYGNPTANPASCINPNTGATFTGGAGDIIQQNNFSDSWTGSVSELSFCKIYLQISFGGTYANTYNGNPSAGVYQKLYGFAQALFNGNTWLKSTLTHKFKNTITKAFMVHEAFSRIVEAVTANNMKAYSEYYGRTDSEPFDYHDDGCGSLRIVTSGLHVRQFPSHLDTASAPNNRARISLSFDQLYEEMDAIDCLGYGIETDPTDSTKKVVRIEPFAHFYDKDTVIMECDNISKMRTSAKTESYISKFEFGYSKWEAENTMGLDEFNTTREYRNNLKSIKRTLSKTNDFIASGYTLEVERHEEMINDSTKDTNYDNEVFLICVRRGDGIEVEQGVDCLDIPSTENIIDPDSVYNARITPVQNMLRWLSLLNLTYFPLWNDAAAKWIFAKGKGNFNAGMQFIGGCSPSAGFIKEKQDVSYTDVSPNELAKPKWKPQIVDYDYPCSWAQYNVMKNYPYGVIKYREFDTQPWSYGFIDSVKYRPSEGKATFELRPIQP